jgi:hypothetical protein
METERILNKASRLLKERGDEYGDATKCFGDAAAIATVMLRRTVSRYEVAKILEAVKIAREAESPHKEDSYVDRINYVAFACQFRPGPKPEDIEAQMEAALKSYREETTR